VTLNSDIAAIVPMKPLSNGKSRLARSLTPEMRADLAIGMLRRVLMAVKAAPIDHLWVVGGDERVRNMARNHDALWFEEMGRNLNDTLGKAIDQAFARDKAALYLAGDLPFIKPSDIHALVQASRGQGNVTLAPARRDGGTNGILVPHGVPFRPELGRRSFSKHLAQAARLETSVAICYSPGLGFDLDIVDDLETYQHMEPGLLDRLIPGRPRPTGRSFQDPPVTL
jgi:2-phospho-L-lactate guanylyltransferase